MGPAGLLCTSVLRLRPSKPMLSLVSFSLGLHVGSVLPSSRSARVPAVSMAALESNFVYESAGMSAERLSTALGMQFKPPTDVVGTVVPTAVGKPATPAKSPKTLEAKFVYGAAKPVSSNFAANMGNSCTYTVVDGTLSPKIAMKATTDAKSQFSSFVNGAPEPLGVALGCSFKGQ